MGLERGRCIGHAAFPVGIDEIASQPRFANVPVKRTDENGKSLMLGATGGLFAFITVVPRTVCEACPWSWSVHQGGIYAGKGLESAKDKIRCGDCRLGIRRRNHGGENFRCAR